MACTRCNDNGFFTMTMFNGESYTVTCSCDFEDTGHPFDILFDTDLPTLLRDKELQNEADYAIATSKETA